MKLTDNFINNIAEVFYDKEVKVYDKLIVKDAEGGKRKTIGPLKKTVLVNVTFTNLDEMRKEYGLDVYINASITCRPETFQLGDIVEYANQKYEVMGLLPFDSHQKAAIKKYGY